MPFRDRVVQHALVAETLPAIERTLVPQTYAWRAGRGTHRCLRRAVELARRKRFVLHVDLSKFFASIDHASLRVQLDRVTPPALRWLRDAFLDAPLPAGAIEPVVHYFAGDELFTPLLRPHGLPIGSLTSQIWANLALSPIDHLLADRLGIASFVRYCDDILVFDGDPVRLREVLAALHERTASLRLRLHPRKTRLHRTTDPVKFLGFVLQRRGDGVRVLLANDNVRRMRQRVGWMRTAFGLGLLEVDEVTARLRAWLAHALLTAPQYRVERLHRTAQELGDRASSVVAFFTTKAPRRSRVLRWATKALEQDPRRWLQFHPLPDSDPGLVVMYQPLNDDLFVMDLDQLHDTPTPQFEAPPVTPDVGVGEAEARRVMIGVVAELEARAILPAGYSPASATLGVYRERQGNGQGGQAEWVTEYQWTMNRIVDGVEVVDAGIRVGIHRDGGLSSLRITDVAVQPLAATSLPVTVDLPLARETFVAHELARNPTATLRVTRERIAVVLDPSADFADLSPSVLFNYSLRFEDPATGAVSLSRQQLTTVSLTTADVHQVFPEGVAP